MAVTVSGWLSFGPALMPVSGIVIRPEFTLVVMLGGGLSVGGSFTGFTVRTNELLAEPPLVSVTLTVIAAAPDWFVAGRTVRTQFDPLTSPAGLLNAHPGWG